MAKYTLTKKARLFQGMAKQEPANAGNCLYCEESVFVGAGQTMRFHHLKNGDKRPSHKRCRP